MKSLFSQLALVFPQFWVFKAREQKFPILKNSKWPYPSHRFNAKIGLKNRPPWAEIFAKMFLNLARQNQTATPFFPLKYLGPGCSVFPTSFCIDFLDWHFFCLSCPDFTHVFPWHFWTFLPFSLLLVITWHIYNYPI